MSPRGGRLPAKHRKVQEIFLDSVEALAQSPEQLVAAVAFGLDRVFEQLLRQACEEVGVDELDDAFLVSVQARLDELFSHERLARAQAEAQRKEIERHLYVLRFLLSGAEPAPWVWQSLGEQEVRKLRAYRAAGGEEDPVLLARVERALAKIVSGEGFGRCESCAQEILPERLQLLPFSERCTSCQRRCEQPDAPAPPPRVPLFMFFEGGKPVPPDRRLVV